MTDMHREGFESWACNRYSEVIRLFGISELFSMSESDGEYDQDSVQESWEGWQAALSFRDEQDQTSVWRCYKEYMSGDGGRVHSEKFAKTKADMLIFKSQGYDCEKLSDEQEKQA